MPEPRRRQLLGDGDRGQRQPGDQIVAQKPRTIALQGTVTRSQGLVACVKPEMAERGGSIMNASPSKAVGVTRRDFSGNPA